MNLDDFKNPLLVKELSKKIKQKANEIKALRIMHVCGTHENSIVRYGLRELLPQNIKLLSGPGCPVCVTSSRDIDAIINFGIKNNCTIATFGDMLRVPATKYSLYSATQIGLNVKLVYSLEEAIQLAKHTQHEIIFFSVGFETTAAPIASIIENSNIPSNLSFFSVHKYTPNGVLALLKAGRLNIDALILPGHASIISGLKPYQQATTEFGLPAVAAGFEPVDILSAVLMIIEQKISNKIDIENEYSRLITYEGNLLAQKSLNNVFFLTDGIWRGLGNIENASFEFQSKYDYVNAKKKFSITFSNNYIESHAGCKCTNVILGEIEPTQCPLFKKICTPQNPVGPCMVSDEGTCRNWWEAL